MYKIQWSRFQMISPIEKIINLGKDSRFTLDGKKSLVIRSPTVDDGGFYFCYKDGALVTQYEIEIVPDEKRVNVRVLFSDLSQCLFFIYIWYCA